jgi:hypothetical protein
MKKKIAPIALFLLVLSVVLGTVSADGASRPLAYVPTGTGVLKISSGVQASTASQVANADVDPSAAIDVTKIASCGAGQVIRSTSGSANTCGKAVLTTDVTGTLPLANGGTGQTSFASGALSSNGSALTSGTLSLANGGTGQTSFSTGALSSNGSALTSGTLSIVNGGTGQTSFSTGAIISNGSSLTNVAPGTSGNLLTSNGTTWTSATAPSAGWVTLIDEDFTAESNQTLTSNGSNTIGSYTWTKSNTANEQAAMQIVNGSGLKIQAHAGSYSTTRTAPLIWLPFSQISPSTNFTLMSHFRIWLFASAISGSFGNGDKLFAGIDTNSNGYMVWEDLNFPIGSPSPLQLEIGRTINGTQSSNQTGGGQGNQDWSVNKVYVLHGDRLAPMGAAAHWLSFGANATSSWPNVQTGLTPFFEDQATNAFGTASLSNAPSNILTGYGISLGMTGTGSDPIWTVARLKVEYLP